MAQPDEQRFERLHREHYDRLAAYLLRRADREVAEEVLARTFEIAWRRFAQMPEEPLPWLIGVARNVLSSMRRSQGRRDALIERIASGGLPSAEDHADLLARRELVAAALAALSDAQREVLLLIAWEGLSQKEAATVIGCSAAALRVRLHRARRRLHHALAELQADEACARPEGERGALSPRISTSMPMEEST